jgi:hypothetical protein
MTFINHDILQYVISELPIYLFTKATIQYIMFKKKFMVDMFIYFTLSSRRNFTLLCNESHNENAGFDVKLQIRTLLQEVICSSGPGLLYTH